MTLIRRCSPLLLLLLSACAGRDTIKQAYTDGKGTSETYGIDSKTAFELCRTVLYWEGAKTVDEFPDEQYMMCRISGGYGCGVGVWINAVEEGKSKVTVITKRNVSMSLTTGLTETTFQRDLALAVGIHASGQPVPLQKPEKKPE